MRSPQDCVRGNDHKTELACSVSYLEELQAAPSEAARSELAFSWLCDDTHRTAFCAEMQTKRPSILRLRSCALPEPGTPSDPRAPQPEPWVYLLFGRSTIETALTTFSNAVYRGIGSGSFVLGMDLGSEHNARRKYLIDAFKTHSPPFKSLADEIHTLAICSCQHAMVGPMKSETFDLVTDVAEQATLRFIAAYFGFLDADHVLLQETLRAGFESMVLQMFARHFVNAPLVPATGKAAMGKLTDRIAELLREASDVTLINEVFAIIDLDPGSGRALTVLANDIGKLEPSLAYTARSYVSSLGEPGLPRRTVTFLDEALNFGKVRAGIRSSALRLPDEIIERLTALIDTLINKKLTPDGHLVPRRWLRDGTLPAWDDTQGDYCFRKTLIERLAADPGENSAQELAINVIGSIAGVIGNVIASAAITIDHFFKQSDADIDAARLKATPAAGFTSATVAQLTASAASLAPLVNDALRVHPPAPFVPRTTLRDGDVEFEGKRLLAGTQLLIPLGAIEHANCDHIWGHPHAEAFSHRCIGEHIAKPLVQHIVRSVLALPGLARVHHKSKHSRLEKKWGYICKSFPLRYRRDRHLVQRPLNIVMTVRHPSAVHAEKLKLIIKYGAPQIEQLLVRSEMVHFARFIFLNDDTQLALMTTYDGSFETYIRHFATSAGPLFDMIFEHIEDPPPMPVRDNPSKFVEHLARYDLPAAQNYFFSARPTQTARGAAANVSTR